jgi:hypothetical protein
MGGSEEAVLYLSQQLALLGHHVVVYANPLEEDYYYPTSEGVVWRHHALFDQERSWDLFVSWRYGHGMHLGRNSRRAHLWLQDLVSYDSLPPPGTTRCEHILVLGEFHRGITQGHLRTLGWDETAVHRIPVIMANAAVDDNMLRFMDGTNHNDHFVYGSNPVRGLEQILMVWSHIRDALRARGRNPTLSVYVFCSMFFLSFLVCDVSVSLSIY